MIANIKPSTAKGVVSAPPSKSMSHRLLLCAGMAKGKSVIHGVLESQDIFATIDCLSSFGVKIDYDKKTKIAVVNGVDFTKACPSGVLNCRESASTLRFFIPPALVTGKEVSLTGAPSLLRRPMGVYSDFCAQNNLFYKSDEKGITVKGVAKSGKYTIPGNISSQFISGFLFALPLLNGDSYLTITPPIESRSYIDLTLSALNEFGISAKWKDEKTIYIPGNQSFCPHECTVEGDYSNAAFLDAFNILGGDVTVTGLNENTLQGDSIYSHYFELLKVGSPAINIGDCPDLGPILFAISAVGFGGVFSGTRRLKIKESDRAAVMAEELEKFGVRVTVREDSVVVYPQNFHKPRQVLQGHNDHRIVMALAVLASKTGGTIEGAEAVTKSFPNFFDVITKLGVEVSIS